MFIGIEIGGTKLQLGLGAGDGVLAGLWRGTVDVAAGPDGIRREITAALPALLAARTAVARAARRRVRRHDAAPVDDPAELVPERCRRLAQEKWMSALVGLEVGPVGERDLDLHEDVPRPRLRLRNVLDTQIAGRVEPRSLHVTKTTFSASPRQ